jgi:hypothetical protein
MGRAATTAHLGTQPGAPEPYNDRRPTEVGDTMTFT